MTRTTAEKAEFTRFALQAIANDTDPVTAERIEKALGSCGDLSLARLFDMLTTPEGISELEECRDDED